MKYLSKLLVVLSLCMVANFAEAATKIGYVEIQKIMQSPASLDAGAKLQKEFSSRQDELSRMARQIDDKETAMNKQLSTTSNSDQKDLNDLKLDYARKQRELKEDFDMRKNEEQLKLQNRVNDAVNAISQAEGYDLVLYGNAAYFGKNVDITDKVIKALK